VKVFSRETRFEIFEYKALVSTEIPYLNNLHLIPRQGSGSRCKNSSQVTVIRYLIWESEHDTRERVRC